MTGSRLAGLVSGRRTKFGLLALWLALTVVVSPLAVRLAEVQENEALGALPATAEARRAADRAALVSPQRDALVAVAVYVRDTGLRGADRAKVAADRAAFAGLAAGQVPEAQASADGKAMLLAFALAGDGDEQSAAVDGVRERLAVGRPAGLHTALTGSAGAGGDLFDAFEGMDTTLLVVTAAAVAMLLLLTYRSPFLWLVPLLTVAVASQFAGGLVYLLARRAGLAVDFQSQSVLTVLVFGVGIDYGLLLIARYREELRRHADRHAAMATALRRSFAAVLASAATVAAGLLCLLAARLPATRGLGPVCAIGVGAALLVMTTLLPAVLVLFGRWLFWPFVPRPGDARGDGDGACGGDAAGRHRLWEWIARGVGRRPRAVWAGAAVVLAVLTLGIGRLSIGLPADESFTTEVGSVTGQHLIEAHYPGGAVEPEMIVTAAGSADRVAAAASAVRGVAGVGAAQRSADGSLALIPVVLLDSPKSQAATGTVDRLRTAVHAVPGAGALVGGATAEQLDHDGTVARDDRVVMPLVLAVVLMILVLLLRAAVAPLVLMASVVVSYVAALGAAGLILAAIGHPRLWNSLPLQAFLFLVALGVDYTIFLMTRAREEVAHTGHGEGILRALSLTGGVITSAGVVLAATFSALGVLPLVPSVQTGIIVAVGVLLDTFVVRSLLIPALALHIGPRIWWPGPLARREVGRRRPAPDRDRDRDTLIPQGV